MVNFTAIVLAAGKGVRMKSPLPKVLHNLRGKPLVNHVLGELSSLRFIKQTIVVTGYKAKEVEVQIKASFKGVEFVKQEKLFGTASAVLAAQAKVKYENVIILCADAPLITKNTLNSFISFYLKEKNICSLITANMAVENEFGKIIRDEQGNVQAIREKIDLENNPKLLPDGKSDLREINSGMYAFDRDILFENLNKISQNESKGEYFFTDIIEILYKEGNHIGSFRLTDNEEILGINNRKDLSLAEEILRKRTVDKFIEAGVDVLDPKSTFIADGAKIGKNTLIYPFTFIEKNVIIGSHCRLGPFIHLREGTRISDNTQIGNFTEICRSKIGKQVRIKHFSYLGDTTVQDKVNIGAGTVVANYDGKNKNKTVIEKGAFIGSDTVLIAPVRVGKAAVTGAGSIVRKNVKAKTVVAGVPAKFIKNKKG